MLRYLNRLSWQDIEAMERENLWYVLPISALEQHGKHLPLGTDDFVLQAVLDAVVGDGRIQAEMLVLPSVHYGNSHEHLQFPGTVSLRCSTIVSIVRDVLHSMHHTGVNRLVFLNSHGGNTPLLDAYAQEWGEEFDIKIYNVSLWNSDFFSGAKDLIQTPMQHEIHGGEIETAIMQYIMPEMVNNSAVNPDLDCLVELSGLFPGWDSATLSPENGVLGAPSKANAETGENLVKYAALHVVNSFVELSDH